MVIGGKIDCYKNFIYLPFVSRKNKPIKIQKRFHLVNSETFLSHENEGYIRDNVKKNNYFDNKRWLRWPARSIQERLQKDIFH